MAKLSVGKERQSYHKWYMNHRAEFNAARRERYAKDKEYRKKATAAALRYRVQGPTAERAEKPLFREVNGKLVRVFRISEAAEKLNRTAATIRVWENRGLIPDAGDDREHRVYTSNQIELMRRLIKVFEGFKYNPSRMYEKLDKQVQFIADRWGNA